MTLPNLQYLIDTAPDMPPTRKGDAPPTNYGFIEAAAACLKRFKAHTKGPLFVDARHLDPAALEIIRGVLKADARPHTLWTEADWEKIGNRAELPIPGRSGNYITLVPQFDGPNAVAASMQAHAAAVRTVLLEKPAAVGLLIFIPRFSNTLPGQRDVEQFLVPGKWLPAPYAPHTPATGAFIWCENYAPDFYAPPAVDILSRRRLLSALGTYYAAATTDAEREAYASEFAAL